MNQARFGSGRQDARPRTRRVFVDVEQRGRGHGDELAISHNWALLKEEKQIIYKGTTNKGLNRKGSFNDDMPSEGMLFCPFFNGK